MGKWSEKTVVEKCVTVIMIASCVCVLVLAFLQIFGVWEEAVNVMIPFLGIDMLCQAYLGRNTSHTVSIFSLIVAGVIFVCFAAALILNNIGA